MAVIIGNIVFKEVNAGRKNTRWRRNPVSSDRRALRTAVRDIFGFRPRSPCSASPAPKAASASLPVNVRNFLAPPPRLKRVAIFQIGCLRFEFLFGNASKRRPGAVRRFRETVSGSRGARQKKLSLSQGPHFIKPGAGTDMRRPFAPRRSVSWFQIPFFTVRCNRCSRWRLHRWMHRFRRPEPDRPPTVACPKPPR